MKNEHASKSRIAETVRAPLSGMPGMGIPSTGALVGHIDPATEEAHWRRAWSAEPYFDGDYRYEDYAPAFRLGTENRCACADRSWDEVKDGLAIEWERASGGSRLAWNAAQPAVRAAWDRVDEQLEGLDAPGRTMPPPM